MVELKKNKKAFESQVKIYKSLRRLLLTKPLADIKVADISEESGISRSSFYRNFQNVVEVLEVMLDYFYNRYLEERWDQADQLLFFFKYWANHRDLISIIAKQNETILKDCLKRYDKNAYDDPFTLDIKTSLISSILCMWSINKKYTPEDMVKLTSNVLNKRNLEILLTNEFNDKIDKKEA